MILGPDSGHTEEPMVSLQRPNVRKVVGKVNTWVKEVINYSRKSAQTYTKRVRIISEPKKMGLAKWLAQLWRVSVANDSTRTSPSPASNISWLLFTNIHPAPPLDPLPLPASKYKKATARLFWPTLSTDFCSPKKFYSAKLSPGTSTYWESRLDGISTGALNYFLDIKSILTDISMIQN